MGRHVAASSARTWTLRTPPSAQAQPHISRWAASSIVSLGIGETMSDSGAIDHTGMVSPVSRPAPSSTGSLYRTGGEWHRRAAFDQRDSGEPFDAVGSIKTRNNEAGRETVFGRQRAAVHLITDQDIGLNAGDRKILDVGIDGNAAEFTEIRAVTPNVSSGLAWPTIGQNVGKPDATPPDVANASRRLERRERTAATLMNARHFGLWIMHQVVEPRRARVPDHAVDRQRPSIPFEARDAEVAQHKDVLRARFDGPASGAAKADRA